LSSRSWTYVGNAIAVADRPFGLVFRPTAVYNPNTKLYVLWWNWYNSTGNYYAAATGPTPAGPFKLQVDAVNVTRKKGGDFHLFVDDDGTGYVIYSWDYWINIDQLTPDFLHSTTKATPNFPEYFVEAPNLFKRNGIYYALFDHCCCYCVQGSGIIVHTATHPLGPYTAQAGGDLCCVPSLQANFSDHPPTPGQGCQYADPKTTSTTRSQQNFVIQVDTPTGIEYVWTGDRWMQAPDGIKGHEPQFWVPLQFDSDGRIEKVQWVDEFTIDVL